MLTNKGCLSCRYRSTHLPVGPTELFSPDSPSRGTEVMIIKDRGCLELSVSLPFTYHSLGEASGHVVSPGTGLRGEELKFWPVVSKGPRSAKHPVSELGSRLSLN